MKYIKIEAMAYTRQTLNNRLRGLLEGALQEYACREFNLAICERDYWSNEVQRLCDKVRWFIGDEVKTKSKFNKLKVLQESLLEAPDQTKIVSARTKVENYLDKEYGNKSAKNRALYKKLREIHLDDDQVFTNMITEFLPEYLYLLKGKL